MVGWLFRKTFVVHLSDGGEIAIGKIHRRHVWGFAFRIVLLAVVLILFFTGAEALDFSVMPRKDFGGVFLCFVWVILAAGMIRELFPNKRMTLITQKHHSDPTKNTPEQGNGLSADKAAAHKRLNRGIFFSAVAWIFCNAAVFFVLSLLDMLTPPAALVLVVFYAVCDLVCVLIFCPFQVFFMQNRCCTVCRIHNWDCLMMCTPLILFPCLYSLSLLLISVAVLIRWEITTRKSPHFFVEDINENLCCVHCEDKLCQLRSKQWLRISIIRNGPVHKKWGSSYGKEN